MSAAFRILIYTLLLSALTSIPAHAYLNIESLRQDSKPGLHGSTAVRTSGSSGNNDVIAGSLTSQSIIKIGREEFIGIFNYRYGEASDVKNTNSGNIHIRYAKGPRDANLSLETFAQLEFDEFQNLNSRELVGLGLRAELVKVDLLTVYAGIGAFYENEDIRDSADQETMRGNSYLSVRSHLSEDLSFSAIVYYQPNTRDMTDYRLRTHLGLEFQLKAQLMFNVVYERHLDTLPPPTIEELDTRFLTGITWKY
ncbi:MAG: DUF481 domain-containing protein [Bdellovibrionales bacterium]|nr:DUF481 domain-containing protein [Bdellovibrionales bacterium]